MTSQQKRQVLQGWIVQYASNPDRIERLAAMTCWNLTGVNAMYEDAQLDLVVIEREANRVADVLRCFAARVATLRQQVEEGDRAP